MRKLESELSYYKVLINSQYGTMITWNITMLDKAYQLRRKIITVKNRKNKIKKIFNI